MLRKLPIEGLNPPVPSLEEKASCGQRLIALLRTIEKGDDDYVDRLDEAVTLLQNKISSTSRCGLLDFDLSTAEKVLDAGNKSAGKQTTSGKIQGRKDKANDLTIQANSLETGSSGASGTLDVGLLLSAIQRIFANPSSSDRLLVALGAKLCAVQCDFIMSQDSDTQLKVAEYELMASCGKKLLSGLEQTAMTLLTDVEQINGLYHFLPRHDEHCEGVIRCLEAISAIVALFGTKLARSSSLVTSLRVLGWEALATTDLRISNVSARLLATLPLTGGTEGKNVSKLWSASIADTLMVLSYVMAEVAPVNAKFTKKAKEFQVAIPDDLLTIISSWIHSLRGMKDERCAESFFIILDGLVQILEHLLACEGYRELKLNFSEAFISLDSIMDVIDALLSFPVACETIYYTTKKRLRMDPLDGGILSPNILVKMSANGIKYFGHRILDATLQRVPSSFLLPASRRLFRTVYGALLTSSSSSLRRIIDPSSSVQVDVNRIRWLNTSISARTRAVNSFCLLVSKVGLDAMGKTIASSNSQCFTCARDVEQSLHLICGFIVEHLSKNEETSHEWGSLQEDGDLVVASIRTLYICLISGGEYLHSCIRELIDSVTSSCLALISEEASSVLFTVAMTRKIVIELATACIRTAWPDGAISPLIDQLEQVAHRFVLNSDASLSSAAASAIQVCNIIADPRVPAIEVVTRTNTSRDTAKNILSVDEFSEKLESASKDIAQGLLGEFKRKAPSAESNENLQKKTRNDSEEQFTFELSRSLTSNVEMKAKASDIENDLGDKKMKVDHHNESQRTTTFEPYENKSDVDGKKTPMQTNSGEELESEDELPMIVDCGPDVDDV